MAYIDEVHDAWLRWLAERVSRREESPRSQLLVIFDCLEDLFSDPAYGGCPVNNAVAGLGAGDDEVVLEIARTAKAKLRDYIEALAADARLERPAALADAWMLLVDGAFVTAQRERTPATAVEARQTAALLLERWS